MTNQDLTENDFLALFKTKVEVSDEPLKIPEKITFTKGALDKAFAIGKTINDITHGNFEWHGFMLVNKDDPAHIVRDIFIAQGAEISPGATNLDVQALTNASEGVSQLNKEKGTNYNIIGVIHSHGSGPVYHSGQDDTAFVHVINSYCGATQKYFRRPVRLIEGQQESNVKDGKIVFSGSNLEDAVLRFSPPKEEELIEILESEGITVPKDFKDVGKVALEVLLQSEMGVEQTISSGFAYSVVVNLSKETYAEVGVREFAILTGQERIRAIKDTDVETVEVENDVTYDEDKLLDEVTTKFKFGTGNGGSLKWRVRNLVRVWSNKTKGYVWEKEKPRPVWRGKPRPSREGQPAEEGSSLLGTLQNLIGFGEASGWDGEQDGSDQSTQPQWYCGSNPAQQYQQSQYPGANNQYSNNQYVQIGMVEKLNDSEGIELDDLVYQFAYSALGYLSRFRHKECTHSQYMESALKILCNFAIASDHENIRTAFRKAYNISEGVKVDEEKVQVPDLKHSVYMMHQRIRRNMGQDQEQLEFMILFSGASNIETQNNIIKEYAVKFGETPASDTSYQTPENGLQTPGNGSGSVMSEGSPGGVSDDS